MSASLVVFACSHVHVADALARIPAGRDAMIVGADLDGDLLAERKGIRNISIWEHLADEEITRGKSLARDLCEELSGPLRPDLSGDTADVIQHMRHDLAAPLLGALLVQAAFPRLPLAGSDWIAYGEEEPIYYVGESALSPGIFNSTIRVCAGNGISELWHLPNKCVRPSAPAAQGSARHCELPDRVDLVSFCAGLNLAEQRLFLDDLDEDERARLLLVKDDEGWQSACRVRWADLSGLPPSDWSPFLQIQALRSRGFPRLPSMTAGLARVVDAGALTALWNGFLDRCLDGLSSRRAGVVIARGLRPRSVLIGYDVPGAGRCLAAGLQDEGTPVLALAHAGLMYESDARDAQGASCPGGVWGATYAVWERVWRKAQVFAIGSLRPDLKIAFEKPLQVREPRRPARVLLLTARQAQHHNPTGSMPRYRTAWRELTRLMRERSDLRWFARGHPRYEYRELWPAFEADSPVPVTQLNGIPLRDALDEADVVILPNYATTAALEALVLGIPVIYLRQGVFAGERSIVEEGGAVVVDDVPGLEQALDRLLTDPAARERQVRRGRQFAEDTVGATGSAAVARLRAALADLARSSSGKEVDPGLRWMLDLLVRLEGCVDGLVSVGEIDAFLRVSRPAMADLRRSGGPVDVTGLTSFLQTRVSHAHTATPCRASLIRLLQAYLPGALGGSRAPYRNLLAAALANDIDSTKHFAPRLARRAALALVGPRLAWQRFRAVCGMRKRE